MPTASLLVCCCCLLALANARQLTPCHAGVARTGLLVGARAPVLQLRGGADAVVQSPHPLAWLKVILRLLFPGNPARVRAEYVPRAPPPPRPQTTWPASCVD